MVTMEEVNQARNLIWQDNVVEAQEMLRRHVDGGSLLLSAKYPNAARKPSWSMDERMRSPKVLLGMILLLPSHHMCPLTLPALGIGPGASMMMMPCCHALCTLTCRLIMKAELAGSGTPNAESLVGAADEALVWAKAELAGLLEDMGLQGGHQLVELPFWSSLVKLSWIHAEPLWEDVVKGFTALKGPSHYLVGTSAAFLSLTYLKLGKWVHCPPTFSIAGYHVSMPPWMDEYISVGRPLLMMVLTRYH